MQGNTVRRDCAPLNYVKEEKKIMKKRVVCLILSLALCLGLALPAAAAFSDVPASHWAYDSVNDVVDKGLFNGTSATTFSPNSTMTRAMLITVLYRYAGAPAVDGTVGSATTYTDVADSAYYADAVIWGVEHDIFPMWFLYNSRNAADVSTTFQPNAVVNRAEFASMLYSFMQDAMGDKADETDTAAVMVYLSSEPGCRFTDMTADAICQSMPEIAGCSIEKDVVFGIISVMMGWAYPNGILTGTSATTMSPEGSVTRAQVAAMLARFYQKYGEASHGEEPSAVSCTDQVIQLVNEQRAQNGLAPLQTSTAISEAAQIRAGELPSLFEHTRPDGRSCFTVLAEVGRRYGTAGENIAYGYATPEQVVDGWMNSPGHRANILNGSFTAIGVGYNPEGNYWVQLFIG